MRLIDADALTEKCGDWYVEEGTEEGFIGTLGQLLSVQPETNCSEFPNNSDTISRQQAIDEITEYGFGDTIYMSVAELKRRIEQLPSAQPEHMHTVMLKIAEKYEKAMNTPCILNPMAWALYQTWKEYDR